jgi:tricorn protease interacting factor F2/3
LKVESYDIFIDVDLANLHFYGKVKIKLESETDVKLNAVDLEVSEIKANQNPVKYVQSGEDLTVKTGKFSGTLDIGYRGTIQEKLVGLYKAAYEGGYIASTQFEAASARRMLPCLDHPAYKAEFKLTVKTSKDLDVISNTPPASSKIEGSKKVVEFQKTPRMSTYLLYLGVGKFEEVKERHDGVEYAVATVPGKSSGARFPLNVAKGSVQFFEKYFGIKYVLPKLHLIAVPEFAAGAMENWGAITFREIALLVDKDSSVRIKKQVAEVIAHEVSHQWFGNLVTMKWWDDLWLNESFATFMAAKAEDAMFPKWKTWEEFVRLDTAGALSRDSILSTHPIEVKVNSPTEIEEVFDDISYGKGASVIRMLEAYTGEENFMKGVRSYLQKYKYSNAAGTDLWTQIEEASKSQVKRIMGEWIKKPGYPMLSVGLKAGKLSIKQERFLFSGTAEKTTWPVPITMKLNGTTQRLLMDKGEELVDVSESVESVKLNLDQTGFYRVHYDGIYDKVWKAELSALDRYGIISDAYAFAFQGKTSFSEYLGLVERYTNEEEYLPAYEVSDQLASLYALAPRAVAEASKRFHRVQLKILANKTDENSILLRGVMAGRLALVDEDYARETASKFKDYDKIEPDMRAAVVTAFARSTGDFDTVLRNYKSRTSEEEKARFLAGLTSYKDPSLVSRALSLATSGEIKKQHMLNLLGGVARNPDAVEATWDWLSKNLDLLRKIYEGVGTVSRYLTVGIPYFGIGRAEELKRFFAAKKIPEAGRGIEAGMERLKINEDFLRRIGEPKRQLIQVRER